MPYRRVINELGESVLEHFDLEPDAINDQIANDKEIDDFLEEGFTRADDETGTVGAIC